VFGPVMARTMIGRPHDVKVRPKGMTLPRCVTAPPRRSGNPPGVLWKHKIRHRLALLCHANHESEPRAVRAFRNDVT